MIADELLKRNMENVHQKESAGKKFGKHDKQQSRVIIISCMSPWVDPANIFSLEQGDAYVIRNAGNIVTQDTMRCILLAMTKDKITDIVVLGHLACTNADVNAIATNYRALVEKIPQASKYRELLDSKDKVMKYFMMYQSEIDNVLAQVENVRFFKTIQPSINITGMLYNGENGLVYSFSEIKELKKLMERESLSPEKISKIIPKRYKEFLTNQKGTTKQGSIGGPVKGSTPVTSKPAKAGPITSKPLKTAPGISKPMKTAPATGKPVKAAPWISKPMKAAPATGKPAKAAPITGKPVNPAKNIPRKVTSKPVSPLPAKESTPISFKPRASATALPISEKAEEAEPSNTEPVAGNEEIKAMMDATQKSFDIMQQTMQKSLVKITGVRVSMPKFRAPVIRIAGMKMQEEKQE
ncbi:MAG TPA: carbonic anhydrase [Candidatus Lokiarchaeia archaeon]|nr:carbonic anhydrase [Candidatus Lokiarchaeia archaeon]